MGGMAEEVPFGSKWLILCLEWKDRYIVRPRMAIDSVKDGSGESGGI